MKKYMTIKELANITGLSDFTIRTYLGNYRFGKYITKAKINGRFNNAIIFNKKFAYKFSDFLRMFRQDEALEKLIEYCEQKEDL